MIFKEPLSPQSELRRKISEHYRMDENTCVNRLLAEAQLPPESVARIQERARGLVATVREKRLKEGGVDAFLHQYDLSSEEGIALMCLAEALLRIPDEETAEQLIRDKLVPQNWRAHSGKSESLFVNAATWGLMLTGHVYKWHELETANLAQSLQRWVSRRGEPVARKAVSYAMKILGRQFVMGRTIEEALKRARESEAVGYRYSYDMLGEAAKTAEDAENYFKAYQQAIDAIGKAAKGKGPFEGPGISVKLSALYPRYEFSHGPEAVSAIAKKLLSLTIQAKNYGLGLTVDAEEADRLELSLDIIESVFSAPELKDWEGFGLAVQSYQKRARPVIDWLAHLSEKHQKRWMVRLIKGAYWDSEIKNSQERGLDGYPVFTRKYSTDVSFLACAKAILSYPKAFYPQFATHNAYSVAAIKEMVGERRDFEFQCLHGMGQSLYDEIVPQDKLGIPCRVYAPVGTHETLLAYLVRRLLENGANSSFVNRIVDANEPIDNIIQNPVEVVAQWQDKPHPKIPLPKHLYGESRLNSQGIDLSNVLVLEPLAKAMDDAKITGWHAKPLIKDISINTVGSTRTNPHNKNEIIGTVLDATKEQVEKALDNSESAYKTWRQCSIEERRVCLLKMADLLEGRRAMFMALAVKEAGKTIPDAVAEIREAVDFCRYYAALSEEQLGARVLQGPTGELNRYGLNGRGTIVCISPWNFPLAIFLGQVSAALITGNAVIAKPAEQTPIIAYFAVKLFHEAGVPEDVLQLVPGKGETVGAQLVGDARIGGVMFTGSTEVARIINKTLANKEGPIVPFIAETGGQNAMIVDSSALTEQVVTDVVSSAFGSAGQRCSALRVLFVQEECAPKLLKMLKGAMEEITMGDPSLLCSDVGPVIDEEARGLLQQHYKRMSEEATLLYQVPLPQETLDGTYFAPCAFEIKSLSQLKREVFGPFLHIIRYKRDDLDKVIEAINSTKYGLTFGVHSRIDNTIDYICSRIHAGNIYVNRNMIGAVVGVQPFGGEGLSGTGPKAGGPNYLPRLCTEYSISVNTTAAGGNASLMSLGE